MKTLRLATVVCVFAITAGAAVGGEDAVDWDALKDGARRAKEAVARGAERTGEALGDGYDATKEFVVEKGGKAGEAISHGYNVSKEFVVEKSTAAGEAIADKYESIKASRARSDDEDLVPIKPTPDQ